MRRLRTTRFVAAAAVAALMVAACGGDDDAATVPPDTDEVTDEVPEADDTEEAVAPEDEPLTIGVSLASPTIPLYTAMAAGIQQRADEFGNVEILFTDADEDPVEQLNDIQDLLVRGVDGILISPIDAEAAKPAYEAARAEGVVIMSIARNTDPELEDSFIGAPWDKFGRQIADWTCERTGGEGQVAMLKGPAGASFVIDMERGYKGFMEESCTGMEIVFEVNLAPLTADQGLAAAQDALSANPDLRVIYANNDDLAAGAVSALEEQRRLDQVVVTGFDGTPEALTSIEEGRQSMTIALRPFAWGLLGLETIVGALRGESVPPLVEIETTLVDGDNIESLSPDELR